MSFDLKTEEAKSFAFGFYRPAQIRGPISLARFSCSSRGDAGRYGRFWLYGSMLEELAENASTLRSLIKDISQSWAVCDDWGDKKLLSIMEVPPGAAVPAMIGQAKFQPKVSSARPTHHSYEGGATQLVIPVVDEYGQRVDPMLAGYITRKLATEEMLTSPRKYLENPWAVARRGKV
ncbi:hypothetical protein HDIA_3590 [Hartmannibacter diazotrophicus]|uniref:Uncharacterized protein n=1 Tax=Hartmannibacter diazotrophicus TaxID=1482074 RepID=A0A2C9DBN5_9HYPH|nr:hypothetical protein [Hartmannibacter diazotrophicus]SON57131.1 hypothetical protein HDIA_3590 [Hartmannibacter diazotrophicus]